MRRTIERIVCFGLMVFRRRSCTIPCDSYWIVVRKLVFILLFSLVCLGVYSFCCHKLLAFLVHFMDCVSCAFVCIGARFSELCVFTKLHELGGGVVVGVVSVLDKVRAEC